ncbi:nSTAND1 domain-containing NTPase [Streptomyces herbicida]|uniref:nSTAND1 domain-containing NTPase n=1 Tax=Streptomyces herbicida TaxID=3065675 RepID=UPI002FCD6B02
MLTPGPRPLSAITTVMRASNERGATIVVVDQLEELFTLCADPAERQACLDLMLTAQNPEPVSAARVHVQHRHHRPSRTVRRRSCPAPRVRPGQQPAPTRPSTMKARPASRCDNPAPDHARNRSGDPSDNPADNCPPFPGI